jgi:hypothetical protein
MPDRVDVPLKKSAFLAYNHVFFCNNLAFVVAYSTYNNFWAGCLKRGLRIPGFR